MHPKRKLFTIGPPYVARVKAAHPNDEGVVHLAASHESLRVLLLEAEADAVEARREAARAQVEARDAARTARELLGRRVLPQIDPTPCRGVYGAAARCRCPPGRCWFREQVERQKLGEGFVPYDVWFNG